MSGPALIDYGRLLDLIGIEGELLASSVRGDVLHRAVPGCPGLTLGEVARHVGSMYRVVRAWLQHGERPIEWQRAPAVGVGTPAVQAAVLVSYLRSGLEELLVELTAHGPDEPCSTWWPRDTSYSFWRRRIAHETVVHRVDVQAAGGLDVAEVEDEVAVDGIDEILWLWFVHRLAVLGVAGTRMATVGVRTGGYAWLAKASTKGTSVERTSPSVLGEADAVIAGNPMQVYLWLWGRLPIRSVTAAGDSDAIAQLWALLRLATR